MLKIAINGRDGLIHQVCCESIPPKLEKSMVGNVLRVTTQKEEDILGMDGLSDRRE
jgi:hypothetical protein